MNEASEIDSRRGFRILIVDMSKISRKLVGKMLTKAGYETTEAETGTQALEILDKEYFNVVITGLVLDGISGEELCQTIRRRVYPHYVYIIISSGESTMTHIRSGLNHGADEFVEKPIKEPILMARLKLAERIIELEDQIKLMQIQSHDLLSKDALTEVYNRYRIKNDLPSEIARAKRYKTPLSILLCDIDHFKSINDGHGHLAGDRVLKQVAAILKSGCRTDIDWVARYGGEEFMLVLPETDARSAYVLAERLRGQIEQHPMQISESETLAVTMSFGVAGMGVVPDLMEEPEPLIDAADRCLYQAKEAGRNQAFFVDCELGMHGQN